jgi:hypothetical protein
MNLTTQPPPSVAALPTRPQPPLRNGVEAAGVLRAVRPPADAESAASQPKAPSSARRRRGSGRDEAGLLGRYLDSEGLSRQIVALPGARGSVLVVDRDAATLADCRLVAHLAPDEPPENAAIVCDHYLGDATGHWCRCATPDDLEAIPFSQDEEALPAPRDEEDSETKAEATSEAPALTDMRGREYRLRLCSVAGSIAELRWHRRSTPAAAWEPVSMRETIAGLESYEPVRTLTLRALGAHGEDPAISVSVLRAERTRMEGSQIVLNRGLRRTALALAAREDLSMSEIATRCGKVKRDSRGNESGETSWLARRLGIAPEGGRGTPTPWIHTDVLALIARHGLGVSPREVELG